MALVFELAHEQSEILIAFLVQRELHKLVEIQKQIIFLQLFVILEKQSF
jgi:hypothetical protein